MARYLKKLNKSNGTGSAAALKKAQKKIFWQAGLALTTIVLTIVIVFTMTSAWYTNVVQTSGMVFQAEAWGFDGEIVVAQDAIVAAPGDEGAVHLEVQNTSKTMTAVSVSVSKARITETPMRQRLYFYVDTQMTREGETMDRVYLNSLDSYTYTLFSEGKLTLTEELHNDAQLKWQWVYDMLGYYVLGSWDEQTQYFSEIEYLRPVEYDFDDATTTFRTEDGQTTLELATVDGELTMDEYVVELSKTDGYEGTVDPEKVLGKGYYPVEVDENGYGVYVYLCSYAEIEMATQYDTGLAQAAAEGTGESYEIQLVVSAQKNDEDALNVGTLDALNTAIELGTGNVLQLTDDITIPADAPLVIPEGAQVMVDLNGYTIRSESAQRAIEALPGSSVTLVNGQIVGPGDSQGYGVYAVGAEVVLSDMELNSFRYGLYVGDSNDNNEKDSKVRIVDSKMDAGLCTVFVSGNGYGSKQQTQLVVEHSELTGSNIVICGNGSTAGNGRWGTDIQIMDSTIRSTGGSVGAGIFQPQRDSTLTIYNSIVSGPTGIALKGGTAEIVDSQITGTGPQVLTPEPTGSGYADTGDAIYIETNYGYEIKLVIRGDKTVIESDHDHALRIFEEDATNVSVIIHAGTFDEEQPEDRIAVNSTQMAQNGKYVIYVNEET